MRHEVYKSVVAFYRVLAKEWINGRWRGFESEFARNILVSSEPYILFHSPPVWPYEKMFIKYNLSNEAEKEQLKKEAAAIFNEGIADGEIVIGGAFFDYSYNNMMCMMTAYLDFGNSCCNDMLWSASINNRLLFPSNDYFEYSFTMANQSIESFLNSNITRTISIWLSIEFGWSVGFNDGIIILDSNQVQIGRLEVYHSFSNSKNQYNYKPIIQRWVIDKNACEIIASVKGGKIKQILDVKIMDPINKLK